MPIVSFWSSTKRETAQTLSMIAIACHMAVENNTKILMVDTNFNDPTIKTAFFPEFDNSTKRAIKKLNAGKIDIGSGIEGLAKLLASGKNCGEVITDYSKVIYKGRLEAILSYFSNDETEIARIRQAYKDLIKQANQHYDYVFVDVPKGLDNSFTNEILNISDVIVFNITQRQRDIGEKKEIPAVSYNTLFFENANEGQIGDYFLKFRKSLISSNDRNAVFVDEVANAADRVVFKTQEVLLMR